MIERRDDAGEWHEVQGIRDERLTTEHDEHDTASCSCAWCVRYRAEQLTRGLVEGLAREEAKRLPRNRAERRAVERAWRRRRR